MVRFIPRVSKYNLLEKIQHVNDPLGQYRDPDITAVASSINKVSFIESTFCCY